MTMTQKPHILVVDDETDVREVIQLNLGREGYWVTTAADGQSALDLLREEPFDAAILDVMMPGMDGLALCRAIREDPQLRSLPILLLTARDSEMDHIIGLEVGADDSITKPLSPRVLLARIRAMLRRRSSQEDCQEEILGTDDLVIHVGRHDVHVVGRLVGAGDWYQTLMPSIRSPPT